MVSVSHLCYTLTPDIRLKVFQHWPCSKCGVFSGSFDFTPTNHPMFTFKKKNLDMCLYFAPCVIPGKPPQSTWSCLFICWHKLKRWLFHLCCCLETPVGPAVNNKVSLNWELPNPKILPCQHRLQLDHMSCLVGIARLGAPSGWRIGVIFRITSMTPLAHSPGRVKDWLPLMPKAEFLRNHTYRGARGSA